MPLPNLPTVPGDIEFEDLLNIVAKMNKRLEWIMRNLDNTNVRELHADKITAGVLETERIKVGSGTVFDTGYDPTTKLEEADVGNMAYEDLVEEAKLGHTIIDGGYIVTGLINASRIDAGVLKAEHVETEGLAAEWIQDLYNPNTKLYIHSNELAFNEGSTGYYWGIITNSNNHIDMHYRDSVFLRRYLSYTILYGDTYLESSLSSNHVATIGDLPDVPSNTGYTSAASHNHGIADGTSLALADGGSVTFYAYDGDSHRHSI